MCDKTLNASPLMIKLSLNCAVIMLNVVISDYMNDSILIYAICLTTGILAFYTIKHWWRKRCIDFIEAQNERIDVMEKCDTESDFDFDFDFVHDYVCLFSRQGKSTGFYMKTKIEGDLEHIETLSLDGTRRKYSCEFHRKVSMFI